MALEKPVKIISAEPLNVRNYLKELKQYRSLIWLFAYQEIKTLYAQTYFGLLWGIIKPLFVLLVFTLIFKFFLHVPTASPYYLFAFTGMIAWNLFSQIASNASTAVIQKQNLIRKMYFPKLILPLSKILVAGVELGMSLLLLFILLFFEKLPLSAAIFTLPLFIVLNVFCGFAVAVWMNALNIRFRDLNQIVPAIIGIAIWVTPVFYPTTIIPPAFDFFLFANPMAGVIKGYRYALLGEGFPEWQYAIALVFTVLITFAGIWYLSRVEDEMVDYS